MIINSFNLIDGINGLSGSTVVLISLTLGAWFYVADRMEMTILALSLAGATIGFLKYNFTPSRIFMGDTGSLFLGATCSVLIIQFCRNARQSACREIRISFCTGSGDRYYDPTAV
ncbi:MAG: undecaprenyl/decaprenyl-phosphate alpha-N-acetylglucosaminyl 1-phosphate transferase [Saprospiraceae bacterium]|nr:undecaprenyl/decaprenyl-phosphate alpha-N-acetylglucosaminyl 1-phosphate transferase [Saprospiraceae bacterium]